MKFLIDEEYGYRHWIWETGKSHKEMVAWWYERTLPERIEEEKRKEEEKTQWAEFEKHVMQLEVERRKTLQEYLHERKKRDAKAENLEEKAKEELELQKWLQKEKKRKEFDLLNEDERKSFVSLFVSNLSKTWSKH